MARALVTTVLGTSGFKLESVASGLEALAFLEDHHVDVIVLDLMLPEVDGIETCRLIRSRFGRSNCGSGNETASPSSPSARASSGEASINSASEVYWV